MIDGAHPFIGVDELGFYHWVVMERGQVLQDRQTTDRDELLYWSFETTTSTMAQRWALHHPVEAQEQRVTKWIKQLQLLHKLNPDWARRRRDELVRSIKDVPGGIPPLPQPPPTSGA
ncbi:Imm63 family immunity protein [Actinomycetes bacterium KLBMP 9797]